MFFNINICRNKLEDVRLLTDFAHDRHVATDYHINETPMIEQDEHFEHFNDNPTYVRPNDWRAVNELIDWITERNRSGYQMVNSVKRLQGMRGFVRMGSGLNLEEYGWYGDGTNQRHTHSWVSRIDHPARWCQGFTAAAQINTANTVWQSRHSQPIVTVSPSNCDA